MNIIAKYKITYENGFSQVKNLISHEDYVNIVMPKRLEAYQLELEIYSLQKKDPEVQRKENRIRTLNKEVVSQFGEYFFTDKSPLFDAITTSICTQQPHARYTDKCTITLLKNRE